MVRICTSLFHGTSNLHPEDLGIEPGPLGALQALWSEDIPEEARAALETTGLSFRARTHKEHGLVQLMAEGSQSHPSGEDTVGPSGRVALTVVPQGEAPAGMRVETVLRDGVQRIAKDDAIDVIHRVQTVAASLLPPWKTGLDHLGDLRWGLMARAMAAVAYAHEQQAPTAILMIHEVVSLSRTRESRRRNNREDLDRFVRRLSGGVIPRLQRGVIAGPIKIIAPEVELYVVKVRRDLP